MRSFKVISPFDVVPITLWLCVFILMNNPWLRILIGLITIGYFLSSNKFNLILWGLLVLVVLRPVNHRIHEVFEGRVIHVNTYGYVVEVEHSKVLVNTEEVLHLDDVITYTGEYVPITNNLSTFGYNKQLTYQKKGIYYEIYPTSIEVIHSKSIIHKLYAKCYELQDQMVMGILFNVSEEENIFLSLGLGLTLFLMSLRKTLSQFMKEKTVTVGMLVVVGYLYLKYSYEYALLRLLVYLLLELTSFKGKEKASINGLILMALMPSNVPSVSFLLPFYFRLQNGLKRKKSETILGSWFIQSFYMNQVNPLMLVVFTFYRNIIGILFGVALIQVLTGFPLITYLYPVLTYVSNFTNKFVLHGNVRGIGLVLYALVFEVLVNFKQKEILRIIVFILFMYLGLFHPMAEVCLINVGQGDSILFKPALSNTCVLLDTGKATSYNQLASALNARGIRRINTLFISHGDEDHNGNIGNLTKDFKVKEIIDTHFESYRTGKYTFYDLNTIQSEDTNESGLVLFTTIQHKNYLFMGDVPKEVEEHIFLDYDFKVYVLKLGHHGSHTSTSDKLLTTTQPDIALISAGKENIYHHPSEETLQRLLQYHVPYISTQNEGDIHFYFFLGQTMMVTSKGTITLI